jgi:osmoprotectant transport system permease protein
MTFNGIDSIAGIAGMAGTLFGNAWQYGYSHARHFWAETRVHVFISLSAITMTALLAVPLGFLSAKRPQTGSGIMAVVNMARVIPAPAILALMLPILGTGQFPVLVALVILAFPAVLLNTLTGFRQIEASTLEAAVGLGMTPPQRWLQVELPLAAPSIMNGLRIATVDIIAGATLGAFIGGGGLGVFIVNGLSMGNPALVVVGALPLALMAMTTEIGFSSAIQRMLRYRA